MAERKNSEKRIATNNRWTNAHYDRINIAVPKGRKDEIKALADTQGLSVNAYIISALDEKIERDSGRAPSGIAQQGLEELSGAGVVSSLPSETVEAAQRAAEAAGEELSDFVARAIVTQAQRDQSSLRLGINPATGGKLGKE